MHINIGLEFIHFNSILHENETVNCLPESLREDEIPSTVYSLSNNFRNKYFSYKNTVKNINTNDTKTDGTGINSKHLNHHHGHFKWRFTDNQI